MEEAALVLFRRGHLPVTGEALALPLAALAGSTRVGDAAFDEVFHPIAERLVARCDAVLRIGGASAGADEMVAIGERTAPGSSPRSRTCPVRVDAGGAARERRRLRPH